MRAKDVDSFSDVVLYYAEVFNPFGYVMFTLRTDRNWAEKVEHALVLSTIIGTSFHIVTAMGTGGYRANLPPGAFHRGLAMKKWTQDMMYAGVRRGTSYGSRIVLRTYFPLAVVGIGVASAVGVHGDSTVLDKHASLGGVPTGSDQKAKNCVFGRFAISYLYVTTCNASLHVGSRADIVLESEA